MQLADFPKRLADLKASGWRSRTVKEELRDNNLRDRLGGGRLYGNSFGLDPVIVARTLDEAVLCRRRRIPITTFMVAGDPYLKGFVEQLTERNRGRAYFSSPDRLGDYLLLDFLKNRRRRVR